MQAWRLRDAALVWQATQRPAVVVEVQAHRGSVPRETGTRMLVAADEVLGSIGGGHLELKAIDDAQALLRAAAPDRQATVQHIALGPSLGQCCGGTLVLVFTPLAQFDIEKKWSLAAPMFKLQLYGAGHVGRALVRLLADVHCAVTWIDEREEEFPTGPLPQHIQRLCVEPVQAEVATAEPGTFYLVMTHSHNLDLAITQAILARGDFAFFGLIGSKTKRARFESRLRAHGHSAQLVNRLVCPIGVPGIPGKEPEVIAVAVLAQLLQVAAGASSSR